MNDKVSFCLYARNNIDTIKSVVESLKHQVFCEVDILIADDGSTDGTFEYLSSLDGVRFISFRPKRGVYGVWNILSKMAEGYYLVFLTADSILDARYGGEAVREFERSSPETIALKDYMVNWTIRKDCMDKFFMWVYRHNPEFRYMIPPTVFERFKFYTIRSWKDDIEEEMLERGFTWAKARGCMRYKRPPKFSLRVLWILFKEVLKRLRRR